MRKEDFDLNPEVFRLPYWARVGQCNELSWFKADNEEYLGVGLLKGCIDNKVLGSVFGLNLSTTQKERYINLIIDDLTKIHNETNFELWRHAVYVNNGFIYKLDKQDSENHLVNDENIEYGLRLADSIAQKTLEIGDRVSASSIESVVKGFMTYNWDRLRKNGFDTPLVMPETFRKPEFFDLVYGEGKDINKTEIQAFFQSKTIRDWIKKCVEIDPDKKGVLTPFTMTEWGKIFEKYPWPEVQKYILPIDCDESVQRIEAYKKMLKENPKGKADGIFVDIDGTLINQNGYLHSSLCELLVEISKHEKVTIFTGGDVEKQTARLRKLITEYVNEDPRAKKIKGINKFPIVSKRDYRGFLFTGFIIDDIPPENQGFILNDPTHYCGDSEYLIPEFPISKGTCKDFLQKECLRYYYYQRLKHFGDSNMDDSKRRAFSYYLAEKYFLKRKQPSLIQRLFGIQPNKSAIEKLRKELRAEYPKEPGRT